jgi:thiamine pyrophosphokinase
MNNRLLLPQVRFSFEKELPAPHILLVAGGRPPQKEWLAQAATGFPIWCVDSGIDICQASNVVPQWVIGDGDSATSTGWAWGNTLDIPVEVHPPEKNLTDLQLALQKVGFIYGQATVIVTGVWGGRFDHTFSNIYSLMGCEEYGVRGCCAADETEVLMMLKGKDSVHIQTNGKLEVVSLLPLSRHCSGVFIDGVHWPLADVDLHNGLPYAISNRPHKSGTEITVGVESGWLGVYLCWDQNRLRK